MNVEFDNSGLAKALSSLKKMQKEWGHQMAGKIAQRLADLEAAATLEEMRTLPGRCHELAGQRKGQLALDLIHPQRLILVPANDPVPRNDDGGLNWAKVTAVRIVAVMDYH